MDLFVNLPVADLRRSRAFFEALGFAFNDQFCDDTAVAMVINKSANAMLLTREKFAGFTPRPVARAKHGTEVLIALRLPDREAVHQMTDTAIAGGGAYVREPEDHGFMYGRAFADPDGHIWEPFCMQMEAADG